MRDAFKERMDALFLQGYAAMEPPEDASVDSTYLQIAMAQVGDMPVFHYQDKTHTLWSSGAAAKVKNSYARMASVVTDLLERLDAELSNDDVVCTLQVFDLQEWSNADMTEFRRQRMFSYLKQLARRLQLDVKGAETEFKRLLPAALAAREDKRVAAVTAAKEKTKSCWRDRSERRRCRHSTGKGHRRGQPRSLGRDIGFPVHGFLSGIASLDSHLPGSPPGHTRRGT